VAAVTCKSVPTTMPRTDTRPAASAVADAAADYVGYRRARNDEEERGAGYEQQQRGMLMSLASLASGLEKPGHDRS